MKSIQANFIRLVAVMICLFIFSCQKEQSGSSGTRPLGTSSVNIFLTDDPSLVFDHVFLDIQNVEVKAEDDSDLQHENENESDVENHDNRGGTGGGWISVPIHPGVYDILQFRNGLDTLFGSTSFDASLHLKKVRITLGNNNSVVINGATSPLVVKDNDNFIVINLDESAVAINSGGLTNFLVDIDAGRSIKQHGNDFELKAQAKVFSKEKSAGIEGTVLPGSARAIVTAINGTDSATAKPEDSGEFKFIGLKSGTYTLVFHATAGSFADTTVTGIIVNGAEDIHVPSITLH
jgi:Domain of unknown function (DUF4382)